MRFDYKTYFWTNLVIPLLFLALSCFAGIGFVLSSTRKIVEQGFNSYMSDWISNITSVFILFVLITVSVIPLARGGIYLLFEKEKDSVIVEGVVSETFDTNEIFVTKYTLEGKIVFGGGIVVDSKKYYCVSYGNIKTGDHVRIKALPKSTLILEWTIVTKAE